MHDDGSSKDWVGILVSKSFSLPTSYGSTRGAGTEERVARKTRSKTPNR